MWVRRYAPEIQRRFATAPPIDQRQLAGGRDLHPVQGSRRNGCIYTGPSTPVVATIDSLLSAKRDAAAVERILGKALGGEKHLRRS
jgi:hypothetical protein